MSALEHGTTAGGCVVFQHQTEETMAALLLAWKGVREIKQGTGLFPILVGGRPTITIIIVKTSRVFVTSSGEGVCVHAG